MTTTLTHPKTLLIALTAATLVACAGGSDPAATGPSSATVRGTVQGTIGGLRVNDVTFRTAGAHLHLPDDGPSPVLLEDEDAVRNHLDDGMVVTIRGTIDDDGTGDAIEIEFHDLMEATIDDKGGGRITLLGEDLSIDDSTEIVDRHGNALTPADLGVGDRVEVSGHGDGRGGLRATFVRVRDDNAALDRDHEVKGWVIAITGDVLDLAYTRDGPLAVRVDVSGIASPPAIAVGSFVEVSFPEGNPDPGGDGALDAVAIHLEDSFDGSPEDEMEIEGIVTAVDPAGFTVAGQPVVPDAGARFVGGTADDLVVGVKVEVEGRLGDDGVLHAHKVAFKANVRVDANLEATDGTAGTLTLLGIVAYVTPSTELRSFASLGDLNPDDRIEVRGYPTRDGLGINATRIERISTSPNDRAFLRAVVTAKTPTSALTMLGLAIDTSIASFKDPDDHEIADAAAFFAAITPGQTVVKVRWQDPYPASTTQAVDEAELEN
jgi:hypothetical protein